MSSLTMEIGAAIHAPCLNASKSDIQTTYAIILKESMSATKGEKLYGNPRLACPNAQNPSSKSYRFTVLDMLVSRKRTKQIDWQAKPPIQVAWVF